MFFQGIYYVKDFVMTEKFVPQQILLALPNSVSGRIYQEFLFRTGPRKPLVRAYDGSYLVKYTKY